jgi:hypothetical protein
VLASTEARGESRAIATPPPRLTPTPTDDWAGTLARQACFPLDRWERAPLWRDPACATDELGAFDRGTTAGADGADDGVDREPASSDEDTILDDRATRLPGPLPAPWRARDMFIPTTLPTVPTAPASIATPAIRRRRTALVPELTKPSYTCSSIGAFPGSRSTAGSRATVDSSADSRPGSAVTGNSSTAGSTAGQSSAAVRSNPAPFKYSPSEYTR